MHPLQLHNNQPLSISMVGLNDLLNCGDDRSNELQEKDQVTAQIQRKNFSRQHFAALEDGAGCS